jgi:hypothetical protein
VKRSTVLVALVPLAVATVTSTTPAEPAGATAVTWVALFTVNDVAATDPNRTDVAPVRLLPVIVTLVPPAVGPVVGLMADTTGAGGGDPKVNRSAVDVALIPPLAVCTVMS